MNYAYIHYDGCGDMAFYVSHRPTREKLTHKDMETLEGEKMGEYVRCGSCQLHITELNNNFVEEI